MEAIFVPKGDKFRGTPVTTVPTVINKDFIRIPAGELKFKSKNDLDHLRSDAEDRTQGRRLSQYQRTPKRQPRRPSQSTRM